MSLYQRGRANLTTRELKYFQLPVEKQIKRGVVAMELWIAVVEAIFRKRGQATQVKLDTWLTERIPEKNWKDKYKDRHGKENTQMMDLGIP